MAWKNKYEMVSSTKNVHLLWFDTRKGWPESYKISVAASDLRDQVQHRKCSSAVIVDTSKLTQGWVHDGAVEDLDYQSSKLFPS